MTERAGIPVLSSKLRLGTFACRQLVIMYAAWIDDDFHISVLEAFDALLRGDTASAQDIANRAFLRDEYKELPESVRKMRERQGKETRFTHYCTEADLLNRLALNMSSKKFKIVNDLHPDADIRDHMTPLQKAKLLFLQRADIVLLHVFPNYEERKTKLKEMLDNEFGPS